MNKVVSACGCRVLFLGALFFTSCGEKQEAVTGRMYTGRFMGKDYVIDVIGDSTDYQVKIDSVLHLVGSAFDLQDSTSVLSRYNRYSRKDSAFVFIDSGAVFGAVYALGSDLNHHTGGIFDPTLNPIRRAWNDLKEKGWKGEPDLDELFRYTLFDRAKIDLNEVTEDDGYTYRESQMRKADPRIELDFTQLAGAFAMDRIGDFLDRKQVIQWRIRYDKGTICRGNWTDSLTVIPLGISGDQFDQKIRLNGRAFAFQTLKEKNQMIDPTHGYPPASSELIYVGVVAPSLAESVVYSESFMIMGLDDASQWYDAHSDSRVESFMLIQRGEEITSASTVGFDELLVVPDSLVATQ